MNSAADVARTRFARRTALPRALSWLGGLACAAAIGVAPAPAATSQDTGTFPIPSATSEAWELDLDYRLPKPIRSGGRWYWYMPYTVTNNSGADRLFIPDVTVVTSEGVIINADENIPASVTDDVERRLGNPLLERPEEVIGELRQGEDFAIDSVAIWPNPTGEMYRMDVFFAGLSGETQPLLDPRTGEPLLQAQRDELTGQFMLDENGQPLRRPVLARRTLRINFATPGSPPSPREQLIRMVDEESVMR